MPADEKIIQSVKETFTREEIPAKTLLVKEGALAKRLFYIESGCCRCWFISSDGKEVTMNFGFDGNFVSSMESIIADAPSWYNVETLEPCVVYAIPLSKFKELKAASKDFQDVYHGYIEQRLLHYQQLFISRIKDNPEKRYKELLAEHPEIIRRIPQHYIASFLGITSVSLSRIRNRA
ncbi:MAG: Crp/Fnr family transcriptional regulator [Mucilaginibacter sp.]|nr:Crp/Fnr family transcriptional regulator [Mucilaginibacter sp.]